MFSSKFHVAFCRLLKRLMFVFNGFPQLDRRTCYELKELIQRDEPSRLNLRELKEYTSIINSKNITKTVALFVVWNVLMICKYMAYVILTWFEVDYYDFERNIKFLYDDNNTANSAEEQQQHLIKFRCLLTNCTRLSAGVEERDDSKSQLVDDLKYLPIFSLCHPNLTFLQTPVSEMGSLGILVHLFISLLLFGVSIGFSVQQIFNKAGDESLMFIVAPNVTLKLICGELEQMYQKYLLSLENFKRFSLETSPFDVEEPRSLRATRPPIKQLRLQYQEYVCLFKEYQQPAPCEYQSESQSALKVFKEVDSSFIRDCLPAVRTIWWHNKTAHLYFSCAAWCLVTVTLPIAISIIWVLIRHQLYIQARLQEYDKFMQSKQCAIWYDDHNSVTMSHIVELAGRNIGFNLENSIECSPAIVYALFILIAAASLILVITHELGCWLEELHQSLLVLCELVRVRALLLQDQSATCRTATTNAGRTSAIISREKSGPSIMRDLFMEHTQVKFLTTKTIPLGSCFREHSGDFSAVQLKYSGGLRVKIGQQQLALDMLLSRGTHGHQDIPSADSMRFLVVQLIEKLYLNHRLFVELIEKYSVEIAAMILLQNLLAYGSAIIAVYLAKTTQGVSHWANILVVVIILGIFVFITLVSNFHAKSRKLQPLFWSLIAQLIEHASNDLELAHLRQLLIKQTAHIDQASGLAMSAFNFRVTYTNVIQVIVWSSTILVLALKDY